MNFLLRLLGLESGADVDRITDSSWRFSKTLSPVVLYVVLGIGLALALVNFIPRISMRLSLRFATCVLRVGMVLLLLAILAGLEWRLTLSLEEKQQWVVLVDDSASMATRDVAGQSRFAAARTELDKLRRAAGPNVKVAAHTFSGKPLGKEAGQGPTLFRDAVRRTALSRARVDRLFILSDGRDSEQRDLAALGRDLRARGIALGLRLYGSRTAPTDAGIMADPERAVIRLGEELIITGSITPAGRGQRGAGEQGSRGVGFAEHTVTLKENGREVKTFTVPPEKARRFQVRHKPAKKGKHIYTLELAAQDSLSRNNATNFSVNVVEEKINVLLIEGYPRFEFKLMKALLEIDPLVNLVSLCHIPGGGVYVQGKSLHRNPQQGLISSQAELFKYDVVILRDISRAYFRVGGDSGESRLRNLVEFVTKRGGGLVVLGGQDVFRAGGYEKSHLTEVLPFDLGHHLGRKAQFEGRFYVSIPKPARVHPVLQLLPDTGENTERLNNLRELDGSNNVGRFKPLATPLMTRTVKVKNKAGKKIEMTAPIMAYMAVGEGKVLAAAADTFWRWQLQADFDDPPLTMLMANIVRYLAPAPGRKPGVPNVSIGDGTPMVGQELIMSTTLRDKNFDPIRKASLVVTATRPDRSSFRMYPRDLPEDPGYYEYRVLLDQPGRYEVAAKYGKHESTAEFLAGAAAGEFVNLAADHEGMARLTKAAGGEIIGDLDSWLAQADRQPASSAAIRDLEIWNSPLILILFFLLVCADCYLRKRQGLA